MPMVAQRTIAVLALVALSPILIVTAAAVKLTSPGPALYRAVRVMPGGTFRLHKFRTMKADPGGGPPITMAGDPRVTRVGKFLRRAKLDELPQLWNVVRGEMAIVGPRPEDPRFVDLTNPLHREVFEARPGITGPTALAFRDEERTLAAAALEVAQADGRHSATDADLDRAYRQTILPAKLAMDADYLRGRSWEADLAVIARTVGQVLRRPTRR